MSNELPKDIMDLDENQIKKELTKIDLVDSMFGLFSSGVNVLRNFLPIPPECLTIQSVIDFIRNNYSTYTIAQKRQLDFIIGLFKKLKELEDRIDKEFVKSEQFELHINRVLDQIKHEQYNDKLLGFRNALVNLAVKNVTNDFEAEYFMSSLISFTDLHFFILSYFNNPEESLKQLNISVEHLKAHSAGYADEVFSKEIFKVDREILRIASQELKSKGFTEHVIPFGGALSTENAYQRLTRVFLTDFGRRFVSFCLEENTIDEKVA